MVNHGVGINVISPTGHFGLVAEVKLTGDLELATAQLSEYMAGVGADAGLLVGPDVIRILVDTYRGRPSIKVVGEFPIALARGLRIGADEAELEDSVQRWLESLRQGEDVAAEPLRSALAEHVLPSMADGTVRAAGPRMHAAS